MWRLLKVFGGLAFVYAILSAVAAWYVTGSYKPTLVSDVNSIGFVSEEVEIPSTDGITLRAWHSTTKSGAPVIALFHGYRATRSQGLALARTLASIGYDVLMPDFRGCGKSDGTKQSFGVDEARDVEAVIRYLQDTQRHSPRHIGLIGIGTGASAIILAHESVKQCAAAMLIAPYSSLDAAMDQRLRSRIGAGMKPMGALFGVLMQQRIGVAPELVRPGDQIEHLTPCSVLLIGAGRDSKTPPSEIEDLFLRCSEPKDMYVLPEAPRERLIDLNESLLRPKMIEFFDANLK